MAADESMFVRTVLALHDAFKSEDSSLALPSEDRLARAAEADPDQEERRSRVEQQVQQLTLSRRGKRSTMRGSVSSSQLACATPFRSGPMKAVSSFDHNDASGASRPMVRLNRPHWVSLRFPRVNGGECGLFRYGSSGNSFNWGRAGFTLPAMRSVSSADRLHGNFYLQNSTCSEMIQQARPFISATLQLPIKSPYEDSLDDVFLSDNSHISPLRAEHQKMLWEKHTVQRAPSQHGDAVWVTQNMPVVVKDMRHRQETVRRQPSLVSAYARKMAGLKQQGATAETLNGKYGGSMTIRMAANLLTGKNQEMQITAANFIQNQCFSGADAKKRVATLHGIPKLLKLLESDNGEVQQSAAAALRNVIYENNENKMEVKDQEGVAIILRLLKTNREVETRRHLTGLLWNLSSHDMLKEQLGREAVKPLTDNVLVPCSGITEGEDPKLELLADTEVFLNATSCLRNVSSAGPNARKSMRDCDGLIDCLIYYIRGTIADHNPDDQALENCVCILHNLTYQFEYEVPETFRPILQESRQNAGVEARRPGCLAMRNAKQSETDNHFETEYPLLEETCNPNGVEWLWSSITIRMYLSLLAISTRQLTQEASIGAMQNLTAGNSGVSQAMAYTIVQREGGLQQVKKAFQDGEDDVKRGSVCLLKNISRYKELHSDIITQVLPELVAMLHAPDTGTVLPAEITGVCQILNNLSQESVQNAHAVLNNGVLPRIIKISSKERHGSTKAGQAASVLLHTLWRHSELHGIYKKAGYRKTDFINSRTVRAVNTARN
ncbi:plakophilin-2-like [Clarias magur]|uniref:Plakophilin-2-like n=1 Tax=Clarias magur TaxID=1594786 RepID=A0A8J4US51_CLAMG|nr:plakophilin-2-like [Clarias magur]